METRRRHLRRTVAATTRDTKRWRRRMDDALDVYISADGRTAKCLEVRNSFIFQRFGNDDVGRGDNDRRFKPDWSETGLRLRCRESDCTCRITPAWRQHKAQHSRLPTHQPTSKWAYTSRFAFVPHQVRINQMDNLGNNVFSPRSLTVSVWPKIWHFEEITFRRIFWTDLHPSEPPPTRTWSLSLSLSDCGILLSTQFPTSELNGTVHVLITLYRTTCKTLYDVWYVMCWLFYAYTV